MFQMGLISYKVVVVDLKKLIRNKNFIGSHTFNRYQVDVFTMTNCQESFSTDGKTFIVECIEMSMTINTVFSLFPLFRSRHFHKLLCLLFKIE